MRIVRVAEKLLRVIDKDLADVSDLLRAVALMRFPHDQILELVSGYGEIWSATLITHAMRREGMEFAFLNARDVLFVSEEGDLANQKVEWEVSSKLNERIEQRQKTTTGGFLTFSSRVMWLLPSTSGHHFEA